MIQESIVKEVNEAGIFTILADATLDISGSEQLSLCVWYVDKKNNIKEDLLYFSHDCDRYDSWRYNKHIYHTVYRIRS